MNYIDPKEFHNEIVKSQEQGELTQKAFDMLMMIPEKVQKGLYYKDSFDKEDCLQTARIDMWNYWDRYDPNYSERMSAFSYFTSVAYYGLAKGWKKVHPDKHKGTISYSGNKDGEGIYSL